MSFENLSISRLIIHEVFARGADKALVQPNYGAQILVLPQMPALLGQAMEHFTLGPFPIIFDAVFDEIFHPVSRRLVAKCDAVLRIGGASAGADEMVALGREHGKAIYFSITDISAP